jgi:hypothetical protein
MCLVVAIILFFSFFDLMKDEQSLLIPEEQLEVNNIEQIQIIDKSNKLKEDWVYKYSEVKEFEKIPLLLRNFPRGEPKKLDNEKVLYELYITNKGYSSNTPILIHKDSISYRGYTTYVSSEKIKLIVNEINALIKG